MLLSTYHIFIKHQQTVIIVNIIVVIVWHCGSLQRLSMYLSPSIVPPFESNKRFCFSNFISCRISPPSGQKSTTAFPLHVFPHDRYSRCAAAKLALLKLCAYLIVATVLKVDI